MILIRPVGPTVAPYYLRQGPGEWWGEAARRLGMSGAVDARQLTNVLRGRGPIDGAYLLRVRPARRRSGWNLVFAAPKSLSLLQASAPDVSRSILAAQRSAARATLGHLEGAVLPEHGDQIGVVAAAFDHVTNAGGEPHLHTHLLVFNLTRNTNGDWRALRCWFPLRELEGVYHLGLRHHLREAGWDVEWKIRPDGLPELGGVPRAAVRAASTRGQEARSGALFKGRVSDPRRPWQERTARAGWEPGPPRHREDRSRGPHSAPVAPRLRHTVATQLLARGSTYSRGDVVAALARSYPQGLGLEDLSRWVEGFCRASSEVGARRWTSGLAREIDHRVSAQLQQRSSRDFPVGDLRALSSAMDASFTPAARSVATRLVGAEGVVIVGAVPGTSNFVVESTVLCAAAESWAAARMSVALASSSPYQSRRWEALSGITPHSAARRPDVLIVDQAERRPPGELLTLLSCAPDAKLVLIEGGTSLRARVASSLGYVRVSDSLGRADPGPAPRWSLPAPEAASGTTAAAAQLLGRWADMSDSFGYGVAAGRGRPVMVGLGVPETLSLNDAARRYLASLDSLGGPIVRSRGRSFQGGDLVVALRAIGQGIASGTTGRVVDVTPRSASLTVEWPGATTTTLGRAELGRLGHAYAATPRLAARMAGPAFVLGRAAGLGLERSRVAAEITVGRDAGSRSLARGL